MLRKEMRADHSNLVEAVRVMEVLLRDEVCTCRAVVKAEAVEREALEARMDKRLTLAIKEEAMRVEKHLEYQLGLMRTELLGALRDLRFALETSGADGSNADLSNEFLPEEQEKVLEATRKLASSGRPLPVLPAAALTPLTEEPHQERLARLDEAIEREVSARGELDRRLQKEMADLSHQLRMAVVLGVEDSRFKALVNGQLQQDSQEQEEGARCLLFDGDWGRAGKDDFNNEASENLREASESKDFGFGRLQSLLRAQQQKQQQQLLDATAVVPVEFPPEMRAPPPILPPTPAEGQASSDGLLREQEDLRRAGAVCEAIRHDALRDLPRHSSRSRGRGDLGSRQ